MDQASSLRKIVDIKAAQLKKQTSTLKSHSDNKNTVPRVIAVAIRGKNYEIYRHKGHR